MLYCQYNNILIKYSSIALEAISSKITSFQVIFSTPGILLTILLCKYFLLLNDRKEVFSEKLYYHSMWIEKVKCFTIQISRMVEPISHQSWKIIRYRNSDQKWWIQSAYLNCSPVACKIQSIETWHLETHIRCRS